MGFLHLKNVAGFDEEEMFKATRQFHSIPEKEKHRLKWKNHNASNTNIYRGLAPFVDNDMSHKELFDMGLPYERVSEEERKYRLHEETPFPEGSAKYDKLKKYYAE